MNGRFVFDEVSKILKSALMHEKVENYLNEISIHIWLNTQYDEGQLPEPNG